ncbi:MFS transporter [Halosolutus halophilus]|uniref:MFS transporter n=1 Tax=Halosolutus halophilus TaxID=1552990 RepID=UPI002235142E|nr:MFS transporter [Halosolutus halophilus]
MAERYGPWSGGIVDRRTASLLGNVDFRRLYAGHAVSRIGDELYLVASMWLVYALTGSTLYTGLAGFLSRFPQAIGFLLGPLVDRSPLGRLLVVVELAQGVVVLAVPAAAALGFLDVWVVLAIMPALATLARLSDPAQNAAIPRLVDDSLLVRANSLASTGDRAIGALAQAGAGAVIAAVGAVALYAVNAATFAVSALCFALVAIPSTEMTGTIPSARDYLADLREGVSLVRGSVIGHLVVAASLAVAFTGMATAVLPAFADAIGGAGTYGLLVASMTAGTLVGAIGASRLESAPFGPVTIAGFAAAAGCWLVAVSVDWLPAVLVCFGLAFVPVGSYNVLVSAALQTGVPEDLLGRVTSTTGSVTAVVGPSGLLLGGYLGDVLGSASVIVASAIGFSLVASYWLAVPSLRGFPSIGTLEPGTFAC